MTDYDQLLAYGFAVGVWCGLMEADGLIDRWFGTDAKATSPFQLLELYPWIRPSALGAWLGVAAYLSDTFRGFLHIAGMPLGLFLIGKVLVAGGARLALELAHRTKFTEQRTRRLLTAIGLNVGDCSMRTDLPVRSMQAA